MPTMMPSRRKQRIDDESSRKARIILIASAVSIIIMIVAILKIFWLNPVGSHTGILNRGPSPTPTPYYRNIALLGYGGGAHEGGALTDTMMVAHIDNRAKKIYLISVPRDLWVSLPLNKGEEPIYQKINSAYAWGVDDDSFPNKPKEYQADNNGGGNLAKYALQQVTGEKIDHFVVVNFDSFTRFVDALGGVDIVRKTEFDDYWYPIDGKEKDLCGKTEEEVKEMTATMSGTLLEEEFPCRFEHLHFGVGAHHLDGETALKYARSRHSATEGGDFYRSQRQKEIILAVKDKMLSAYSLPQMVKFALEIGDYIDTDFNIAGAKDIISEYLTKKDYEIISVPLTNTNVFRDGKSSSGLYILIPWSGEGEFGDVRSFLTDIYGGMSEASATAKLRATPTPIPTKRPASTATPTPRR